MYERDMTDTEKIIAQLNASNDLLQEISDTLQMILENQNQAYLISGIKKTESCDTIGCNHPIDYHDIACQVSECECEHFYRKNKYD